MRARGFSLGLVGSLVAALTACAGAPAIEVPKTVQVPVPVACVTERPQKPALRTEADLMAMDRYRRTLAAWSDLKKLELYAAELEALVEACARIPH